jgi:hypothetical protein
MEPVYLQGIVSEFSKPLEFEIADRSSPIYQFQWIYVNGLLGVIFSIGLLYTALKTRRARSWLYCTGWSHVFLLRPLSCCYLCKPNSHVTPHIFKSTTSFQSKSDRREKKIVLDIGLGLVQIRLELRLGQSWTHLGVGQVRLWLGYIKLGFG